MVDTRKIKIDIDGKNVYSLAVRNSPAATMFASDLYNKFLALGAVQTIDINVISNLTQEPGDFDYSESAKSFIQSQCHFELRGKKITYTDRIDDDVLEDSEYKINEAWALQGLIKAFNDNFYDINDLIQTEH